MSSDVLEKVKQLPPDKQKQVEEYIDLLLTRYGPADEQTGDSVAEMRRKNMGWAKGKIWMADDFNDTPEDFKDYL